MIFHAQIASPLGHILLCSDGASLTGLYFMGQQDCPDLPGLTAMHNKVASPAAGTLNGRAIRSLRVRRRSPEGDLFGDEHLVRAAGGLQAQARCGSPVQAGLSDRDAACCPPEAPLFTEPDTPAGAQHVFEQTQSELQAYFAGTRQDFSVPLHLEGTPFQRQVWQALLDIPYGEYVSYGDVAVAAGMTRQHGRPVGAAVGQNPITIIVPCHRVLAGSGKLNGYSSGLDRKVSLLELEGFDMR